MSNAKTGRLESWVKPYDPADSPGPIPAVIEHFRWPVPEGETRPSQAEIEASRYTVVLIPPDAAEAMGFGRTDVGLRIYHDHYRDENPSGLEEAARYISEACGAQVTLIEHRADLTYWTAHPHVDHRTS